MRTGILAWVLFLLAVPVFAQNTKVFTKAMTQLHSFATKDSASVQSAVNKWWEERKKKDQVPLTSPDSAVFLYRGAATSVAWAGDFNGWGSKPFQNQGRRIRHTDVWILPCSFPSTARLDYKIIINGKDWILDSSNPHQQFNGVGGGMPNSEIRMPGWKPDPSQIKRRNVPSGTLTEHRIKSNALGYELGYSVYIPFSVTDASTLPVLYTTDGSEYLDHRLGNMTLVLDNLLAEKRIQPLRVVFVDARDPANPAVNRRMREMSINENYLAFFSDELIPEVEETSGQAQSKQRGIMGTSLGGLNAAYFAFKRPDLFSRIGIQSPAFWFKQEIFQLADSAAATYTVCMTAGTIYDTSTEAAKMKAIFDKKNIPCNYIETPEGHSWGNWKNLLDDLLATLYPN